MKWIVGLVMIAGCAFDASGPAPDVAEEPPGDQESTPLDCPAGYDEAPAGNCYRLDTSDVSWDEAATACENDGPTAHLVVIDDELENEFLGGLIADAEVWTGLTRVGDSSTFQWVTGTAPQFFAWESDAPDEQGCVILRNDKSPASWDDKDCPKSFGFVCESAPQ